ncbi:hypothetical protein CAPTEDRAFT_209012 [Capitella teleta]|uniref:Uncharacterized protein n=1 Tax=Capitella teleta TaxID=283909 RepID=R7V7F1_CAPTE|nr:hypothetical protein CAPTEDRAFT_209012 [Capitella teleta]|eukprot:ELU11665.1 hypothetical protein CAPTEDRAFT_209012 [Capitella teleta]
MHFSNSQICLISIYVDFTDAENIWKKSCVDLAAVEKDLSLQCGAPLLNGTSQVELLIGRRLNTVTPVLPKTLQPRAVDQDVVWKKETAAKPKQSTSFNQRHRAKEKPRIEIGTELFIWCRNKHDLVTQRSHNTHSVFVEEVGETILRRNRSALVPTPPQQTEASTVPTTTRSGRIVKPVQRLI